MITIVGYKPIEPHRITLDEETHVYLVDGFKVQNSVSVTELIHGKFIGEPNAQMINGTLVHARVPFFIEEIDLDDSKAKAQATNDIDKQAYLLAKFFHETIGSSDCEYEKRLGLEIKLLDNDTQEIRSITLFGSIDCLADNGFIVEFKTSVKHYKYHETQVLLYKFMYEALCGACSGVYSITFAGASNHSHVQHATIESTLTNLLNRYCNKDKEAVIVDPKGFDFYESQIKIQQLESLLKIEKEKRDHALEQLNIVEAGSFLLGTSVVLKRNKATRSGVDMEVVREKMPEALTFKEYYTNIFTITNRE